MIAGLEDITDGELRIGGEVVNDKAPRDRDIAMVFQNYALYPHMTVRENMAFPLKIVKTPRRRSTRRVEEAAEIAGPHAAPGPQAGAASRAASASAWRWAARSCASPKAFLMDEPLSNLDAKLRVQMRTAVVAPAGPARHDDGLRDPRPDRGDDARRPRGGHARGRCCSRSASPMELYNEPEQPVRGRLHRLAGDELPARRPSRATRSSCRWSTCRCPRPRASSSGASTAGKPLIAGIRPEDFEDAAWSATAPGHGATFKTTIDVLEAMGSEFYAHFTIDAEEGGAGSSEELRELQEDAGGEAPGGEGFDVVARLDQTSGAKPKAETEMWINTEKIQLFDPESGKNLERRPPETWRDGAAVGRPRALGPVEEFRHASRTPASPADHRIRRRHRLYHIRRTDHSSTNPYAGWREGPGRRHRRHGARGGRRAGLRGRLDGRRGRVRAVRGGIRARGVARLPGRGALGGRGARGRGA